MRGVAPLASLALMSKTTPLSSEPADASSTIFRSESFIPNMAVRQRSVSTVASLMTCSSCFFFPMVGPRD